MQLEEIRGAFEEMDVAVAGMTYDQRDILSRFHAANALGYPLLQDVDAEHAEAFGVLNEQYPEGNKNYGVPHPGILFINPDGTIAGKFAVTGYKERPPMEAVVGAVAEILNER